MSRSSVALSFALGALSVAVPACEQGTYPPLSIELVDGDGANPVRDTDGSLAVTVAQSGIVPVMANATITGGSFELDVPIADYEPITELRVTIDREGSAPPLIGATIPFRPFFFDYVRVVLGEPTTCVALTSPRLDGARLSPGLALVQVNLWGIGGARGGGTVAGVDVFSPIQLTTDSRDPQETLSAGFGRTRMVPVGSDGQLLVIDERHAMLYSGTPTTGGASRVTDLALHGGAGSSSALAELGTDGVAVVGGVSGDAPVTAISYLRVGTSSVVRGDTMFARAGASAALMGRGMLVAGGHEDGAPMFEWISLDGSVSDVAFGEDLPPRTGGVLVVSANTGFYYLGRQTDGSLPATSWVITGCPGACTATSGPTALVPRFAPAVSRRAGATVVLGGELAGGVPAAAVEEIRFFGGAPMLVPMGELHTARSDTTAVTLGGGTVLVAGGMGMSGALDSMELCFPEALDPISLPSD